MASQVAPTKDCAQYYSRLHDAKFTLSLNDNPGIMM